MTAKIAGAKIKCRLCGARVSAIAPHLAECHPGMSLDAYREAHPRAPLLSKSERERVRVMHERTGLTGAALSKASAAAEEPFVAASGASDPTEPLHTVFGLGKAPGAHHEWGAPIPITVFPEGTFAGVEDFIPSRDGEYVFEPELVRTVTLGLELGMPVYLWGHAGVGKSTVFEQICARTGRPFLRVQHTANMEETQVIGQYVFRDGATVWEDGPLPFAMRNGMLYLADEYDFALPHVLALYQPALEGKPLVIKEAPPELRVIHPHPAFRICATGNTNGAGDDTGLYQGTTLQNFANYERFGVVERVGWLKRTQEVAAIVRRTRIVKKQAEQLVRYAAEIRKAHDAGRLGATLSLRALIHAGALLRRRGDIRGALRLAFMNRLNATDREVCEQVAQRHFG